jgi:integrase
MHTWTAEQLRHFLALEEASTPGRRERAATKAPRYWPAFVFLATTGCRRGEALGLRWGDVDLEAGSCKFVQTITAIDHKIHIQSRGGAKSGDEREIELDPETIVVLKTWRAKQLEERLAMGVGYAAGDLVFCHPDGRPYHPDRFSREFDRRVKLHEMPRIRLHDLRHTWATLALEGGVDINVVKDRLGHSSIAVTADIYQHVTRKVQLGAAERVASLIFGPA